MQALRTVVGAGATLDGLRAALSTARGSLGAADDLLRVGTRDVDSLAGHLTVLSQSTDDAARGLFAHRFRVPAFGGGPMTNYLHDEHLRVARHVGASRSSAADAARALPTGEQHARSLATGLIAGDDAARTTLATLRAHLGDSASAYEAAVAAIRP